MNTRSRYTERDERINWRLYTPERRARALRLESAVAYGVEQVRLNFPRVTVDNATEIIAFREQCIQDYIASHELPLADVAGGAA